MTEEKNRDVLMVPVKTMEDALGIKERRIRQLTEEGILVKGARGRYILIDSVKNYINHLKANKDIAAADKKDKEIDYEDEHAKHERAKRKKAELELRVMTGELHEASVVEKVMTDMLSTFRSRMLGLPAKLAPELTIVHDVNDIQVVLKDAVMEALHELANYDPELFYSDKQVEIIDGGDDDEEGDAEVTSQDTETI